MSLDRSAPRPARRIRDWIVFPCGGSGETDTCFDTELSNRGALHTCTFEVPEREEGAHGPEICLGSTAAVGFRCSERLLSADVYST